MNAIDLFEQPQTWARSRAWMGANANGSLWAIGNGLIGTTLMIYLAKELGAKGTAVGWILAFPQLLGLFRLLAPWWLDRFPERRRFAQAMFLASGGLLLALPIAAYCRRLSLEGLVLLWGAWHTAMYAALVAFQSYLGSASNDRDRPARLARREALMTGGTILGTLAAAAALAWWRTAHLDRKQGLILTALAGGMLILLSVGPLAWLPKMDWQPSQSRTIAEIFAVLKDRRYRRLLGFMILFSFANGVTGSAAALYPFEIKLEADRLLLFQTLMRVGQIALAPLAAIALARWGANRSLAAAQAIVACGILCYLPATQSQQEWILAAHMCWIAYVVLNIGLPELMLRWSPAGCGPHYIAVNSAVAGLALAAGSVLGGAMFEHLRTIRFSISWAGMTIGPFAAMFLLGFTLRMGASVWAAWLAEPQGDAENRV